jgi:hypothetical protein
LIHWTQGEMQRDFENFIYNKASRSKE